jgi:hypothetical protein
LGDAYVSTSSADCAGLGDEFDEDLELSCRSSKELFATGLGVVDDDVVAPLERLRQVARELLNVSIRKPIERESLHAGSRNVRRMTARGSFFSSSATAFARSGSTVTRSTASSMPPLGGYAVAEHSKPGHA